MEIENIWLSALAGSGKTYALTERLLTLLLHGASFQEIVALTFTNAAALEMLSRLEARLAHWESLEDAALAPLLAHFLKGPGQPEHRVRARALFGGFLESLGAPPLQTVHSFCLSLLKRFPLEAGLWPNFSILEEGEALALKEKALWTLLTRDEEREAWRWLSRYTSPTTLKERILQNPLSWKGAVKPLPLPQEEALFLSRQAKESLRAVLPQLPQGWWEDENLEAVAPIFLTQEGRPRKKVLTTDALKGNPALKDLIEEAQNFLERKLAFLEAQKTALGSRYWLTLLEPFRAAYQGFKRLENTLDFDDIIGHACTLLERPDVPWVLEAVHAQARHVLVDEAQDTSPSQWRLIQNILHPRASLFIVGDPKQSIYRFQGAKADLFEATYHQLNPIFSLQYRSLETSYRSRPEILAVVDSTFQENWASFSPHPLKHGASRPAGGKVELWPLFQEGESAAPFQEGLAHWIKALLEEDTALQPSDILVLMQRRGELMENLTNALLQAGVPVSGLDRLTLENSLMIQDALALARASLSPYDDLSLACVLKSPLIGASEEDLFAWAHNRQDEPLWEKVPPAHQRILECWQERARNQLPSVFFRACLDPSPIGHAFLAMVETFERKQGPALHGFLQWVETARLNLKNEEKKAQGVQLMTVHGAKGLEAPAVLLVDAARPPPIRDELFFEAQEGFYVMGPTRDALGERLHEAEKKDIHAEHQRLLYVAMTRARDQLYVFGQPATERLHPASWYAQIQSGLSRLGAQEVLLSRGSWQGEGLQL